MKRAMLERDLLAVLRRCCRTGRGHYGHYGPVTEKSFEVLPGEKFLSSRMRENDEV